MWKVLFCVLVSLTFSVEQITAAPNHDKELSELYGSFIIGEGGYRVSDDGRQHILESFRVPLPFNSGNVATAEVSKRMLHLLSYKGECVVRFEKIEILPSMSEVDVKYLSYTINNRALCSETTVFASINPIPLLPKRIYQPSTISSEEKQLLIKSGYEEALSTGWIRGFSKGEHKIFKVRNDVISFDANGSIQKIWISKGEHQSKDGYEISLSEGPFIADLDNDGNLELMINESTGFDSEDIIYEVGNSEKDLLIKVRSHHEGESEPTYYYEYSDKLLKPKE